VHSAASKRIGRLAESVACGHRPTSMPGRVKTKKLSCVPTSAVQSAGAHMSSNPNSNTEISSKKEKNIYSQANKREPGGASQVASHLEQT